MTKEEKIYLKDAVESFNDFYFMVSENSASFGELCFDYSNIMSYMENLRNALINLGADSSIVQNFDPEAK